MKQLIADLKAQLATGTDISDGPTRSKMRATYEAMPALLNYVEKLELERDKYVRKYHIGADREGLLNLRIEKLERDLAEAAAKGEQLCNQVGNLMMQLDETYETAQELQDREHTYKRLCRDYQSKVEKLEAVVEAADELASFIAGEIEESRMVRKVTAHDFLRAYRVAGKEKV